MGALSRCSPIYRTVFQASYSSLPCSNIRSAADFPHFSAFRPVSSKLSDYFSLRGQHGVAAATAAAAAAAAIGKTAAAAAAAAAADNETGCAEVSTTVDRDEPEEEKMKSNSG
jgi:hypothetical protein